MRIGSLFSGYGGLDMGVSAAIPGSHVVWHSEIDKYVDAVLCHHWPHIPNYGDITAIDWSSVEPVDILTGGFPCQDVSTAGKRAGIKVGTRSGLWTAMAEAVEYLQPHLVVIENVRGLLSAEASSDVEPCPYCMGDDSGEPVLRALGAVLGDLADIGYDAAWGTFQASDVGACHKRERVFIVAHSSNADSAAGTERYLGEEAGFPASQRVDTARYDLRGYYWGKYAAAIRRWEQVLERDAPAPTELPDGKPRLSPTFVEWMMGLPEGHVTSIGLSREQQLKILGNGCVPQQVSYAVNKLLGVVDAYSA